ncbi:carbon storage regulator [uncultured Paraglaciecola sp.]|uniref:carbon storage regulator n=1 Tax=uncultured Paraglaciecola sp. TaxID=1765024 RepID=UPI00262D3EEE|nr:carbon storage regulator [uncultured Paraglaciecola sp.]
MLVLTRREGESLFFYLSGEEVEVRVNSASRSGVRLGIRAPKEVQVVREREWIRDTDKE